MSTFDDYIDLSERLGCTRVPFSLVRVDASYGMAQSDHNRTSVLHRLEANYVNGFTERILLLGEDACSGFSGFRSWKEYLLARPHVPAHALVGVTGSAYVDDEGTIRVHSGTEAQAAIRYAKQEGLRSLALVAPEFHIARAFMHFVTAALSEYPELQIWPIAGEPLPWDEIVVHSQGTQRDTRRAIAEAEYKKIFTYKELASLDAVLSYMNSRDRDASHRS